MRAFQRRAAGAAAIAGAFLLLGAPTAFGDTTSGNGGVLSGNQVEADVDAPTTACGNAVVGAMTRCDADVSVSDGERGSDSTSGNGSVGSGNQVDTDVDAPVTVCGNAIGGAAARCPVKVRSDGEDDDGDRTSGDGSVGSGNQSDLDVDAPTTTCGNAVIGATAGCTVVVDTRGGDGHGDGGTPHPLAQSVHTQSVHTLAGDGGVGIARWAW